MAYPLVSTVAEKLNNLLQDEVALLVGVTDEIKKLSRTFTLIQAVLKDAETRRSKDESVKIWLQNVKDVAYDVDDILDEWMTEALKSQAPDEGVGSFFSKKKIRSFLSSVTCFNHLKLRHKIGNMIKDVKGRLHDIAEEKNQLGLRADSGEGERADSELRRGEIRERETSSLLDQTSVIGREGEKNEILHLLLQEVTEVPFVISIVGMGGLGKTTLAQLIYNDEKVKEHFDMRMWVCVSEDFDVKRISKSILKSADGTDCDHLDLDPLQRLLRVMLQAKRFLLVLDDVWSKDSEKWEKLRLPFQASAPGSRIIVTTRIEDVAGMMGSTDHMHKLAVLSDHNCWLLFRSKALDHRSEEECSALEDIGRQIVKKCGGVPLAAKTIGSVMHSRRTRSQWELVSQSEMWNSGDVIEGILPALLLSYYDLTPALKQCFAYFSILIVKLWVAQGFICSINGSGNMEEIGELYFDDLLRRSLLQDAEINSDGSIEYCKMHDLVHDLARYVAGSDYSMVEIRKKTSLNINNVRHSFLVDNDKAGDEAHKLASISATLHKAHKLQTLLLQYSRTPLLLQYSRISKVPDKLFHHLRCLRALDFHRTNIKKLPQTVGQLKHLRYLDLSHTDIEELPAELSNCRNLQTLRLNHCNKLRKLPREMGKMIRLRHLEFEDSNGLSYLPEGIGRLTELRTLTKFIVGGDDQGCKCGELKHLNHLQGTLPITGLQNIRSRDEASEAELHEKQHLRALSLEYDDEDGEPLDDEVKRMEDVLKSLQPHTNLKELEIWHYKVSMLPKWIRNPMLVKVKLWHCTQLKSLPELGQLKALQTLEIFSFLHLKSLPEELVQLKALQTLRIYDCPQLKSLPEELGQLKALQTLDIYDCPQLKSLPEELGQLKALQTLHIYDCPQLESLSELGQLKALQTLRIYHCPHLKSLPKELGQLKALQTLHINDCPQLKSLPDELGQLKALQTLKIGNCPQLESLPEELEQVEALQTLAISNCPELRSLPEKLQHLTMLQELYIINCPLLKERFFQDGGEDHHKIAQIPNFTIYPSE
ncbi:disease resistance protein RGA2-like [Magnolia sinica]|uniref:disease resistance protein RGA2-like n=1 Tax=Magnolia sinica TaxID=86752 RepID=UPI00265B59B7|nr:disease resistance protein RGA2-like [Magnolia sinica]